MWRLDYGYLLPRGSAAGLYLPDSPGGPVRCTCKAAAQLEPRILKILSLFALSAAKLPKVNQFYFAQCRTSVPVQRRDPSAGWDICDQHDFTTHMHWALQDCEHLSWKSFSTRPIGATNIPVRLGDPSAAWGTYGQYDSTTDFITTSWKIAYHGFQPVSDTWRYRPRGLALSWEEQFLASFSCQFLRNHIRQQSQQPHLQAIQLPHKTIINNSVRSSTTSTLSSYSPYRLSSSSSLLPSSAPWQTLLQAQ